MAGSTDYLDKSQVDEKTAVQPLEESSDEARHSHQEAVMGSSAAEELHESEQDIPVCYSSRFGCRTLALTPKK